MTMDSSPLVRRAIGRGALLVCQIAYALNVSVSFADAGPVELRLVQQSPLQVAVPKVNTHVQLTSEHVTIVPYFDNKTQRLVTFVNARFAFIASSRAETLKLGFPEMKAVHYRCQSPLSDTIEPIARARNKKPKSPYCAGQRYNIHEDHHRRKTGVDQPSIIAFDAWQDRRSLRVTAFAGQQDYRRWFTFDAAFPLGKETLIKNIYLAIPSSREEGMPQTSTFANLESSYSVNYVVHTGALWNGPIEKGLVALRMGGVSEKVEFANLRPSRRDDIRFDLGTFDSGRLTRLGVVNRDYLLHASSSLEEGAIGSPAAAVLDDDPDTSWISDKRGIGSWVQVPIRDKMISLTYQAGSGQRRRNGEVKPIKGIVIQGGTPAAGASRPRQVKLLCGYPVGNDDSASAGRLKFWGIGTVDVPDDQSEREFAFKKKAKCAVVRVVVTEIYGSSENRVTIAAISPLLLTHANR